MAVEKLQSRELLAADLQVLVSGGIMEVHGTNEPDDITVRQSVVRFRSMVSKGRGTSLLCFRYSGKEAMTSSRIRQIFQVNSTEELATI